MKKTSSFLFIFLFFMTFSFAAIDPAVIELYQSMSGNELSESILLLQEMDAVQIFMHLESQKSEPVNYTVSLECVRCRDSVELSYLKDGTLPAGQKILNGIVIQTNQTLPGLYSYNVVVRTPEGVYFEQELQIFVQATRFFPVLSHFLLAIRI
ncbi:MAG: hypothetical protein ACMXYF_00510 [Candidatus Woesearchaeota archaeon]